MHVMNEARDILQAGRQAGRLDSHRPDPDPAPDPCWLAVDG